jgi:hypothetical protein
VPSGEGVHTGPASRRQAGARLCSPNQRAGAKRSDFPKRTVQEPMQEWAPARASGSPTRNSATAQLQQREHARHGSQRPQRRRRSVQPRPAPRRSYCATPYSQHTSASGGEPWNRTTSIAPCGMTTRRSSTHLETHALSQNGWIRARRRSRRAAHRCTASARQGRCNQPARQRGTTGRTRYLRRTETGEKRHRQGGGSGCGRRSRRRPREGPGMESAAARQPSKHRTRPAGAAVRQGGQQSARRAQQSAPHRRGRVPGHPQSASTPPHCHIGRGGVEARAPRQRNGQPWTARRPYPRQPRGAAYSARRRR